MITRIKTCFCSNRPPRQQFAAIFAPSLITTLTFEGSCNVETVRVSRGFRTGVRDKARQVQMFRDLKCMHWSNAQPFTASFQKTNCVQWKRSPLFFFFDHDGIHHGVWIGGIVYFRQYILCSGKFGISSMAGVQFARTPVFEDGNVQRPVRFGYKGDDLQMPLYTETQRGRLAGAVTDDRGVEVGVFSLKEFRPCSCASTPRWPGQTLPRGPVARVQAIARCRKGGRERMPTANIVSACVE